MTRNVSSLRRLAITRFGRFTVSDSLTSDRQLEIALVRWRGQGLLNLAFSNPFIEASELQE
jgi:hypothetical protein